MTQITYLRQNLYFQVKKKFERKCILKFYDLRLFPLPVRKFILAMEILPAALFLNFLTVRIEQTQMKVFT